MSATPWLLKDGRTIYLLTPDELRALPDTESITSILGDTRLVKDSKLGPPDDDTRGGLTAWGVTPVTP